MSTTRMRFVGTLTFGLLLAVAAVSFLSIRSTAEAHDVGDVLDVCCAWNAELSDGDLTYSIAGGSSEVQDAIEAGMRDWDNNLPGLTLTRTTDTRAANIEIKNREGGGNIQGLARRKFDGAGLVREVDITISGKAFGDPNSLPIIAQIGKHEVGHALGTGHTNFSGDLMSTTVSAGTDVISQCDIDAVMAANEWFFNNTGTPTQTSVTHVHCGPAPTPEPTPDPGEVETVTVQSVDCGVQRNRVTYLITIVDSNSEPVEGAIVSGTRLDPRGQLFSFEGATDANGQVGFRAGRPGGGDHLITVEDVTGPGIDFGDPVQQVCSV